MVAELVESGVLEPDWRSAFEQVPRHRFVPDTMWRVGWSATAVDPR
jgi:protein-L-isoaspartate O-methyltransferase